MFKSKDSGPECVGSPTHVWSWASYYPYCAVVERTKPANESKGIRIGLLLSVK